LALAGVAAFGQPPELVAQQVPAGDGALPRRLTMVARAQPQLTQSELVAKLTDALKASLAQFSTEAGGVRVYPIGPSSYAAIEALVKDTTGPSTGDLKELVRIQPFVEEGGIWQVELPDPLAYVDSLTLVSKSAEGKEEIVELKPQPRSDPDWSLCFHSPGRWLLRLRDGRQPVSYKVVLKKDGGQTEVKEGKWQEGERYWILTVRGYVGNESALFEKLKDPKVVGTPFKAIERPEMVSIILADMMETMIQEEEVYRPDTNTYEVTYPRPPGIEPNRVWLHFPLTEAERDSLLKEIRTELKEDTYVNLGGLIRKKGVTTDKSLPLVPGASEAAWFELPWSDADKNFRRSFPLEPQEKWKSRDGEPVYGLLVYEFGEGDVARPYRVNGEYLRVKELRNWPVAGTKSP